MDYRCVGVWDTVGSVFNTIDALSIKDTDLPPTIDCALHAMSLQENREKFLPTLWTVPSRGLFALAAGQPQVFKQVYSNTCVLTKLVTHAHVSCRSGFLEHILTWAGATSAMSFLTSHCSGWRYYSLNSEQPHIAHINYDVTGRDTRFHQS